MQYTETTSQAEKIGRSAMEKMRELGIPANPLNYTTWYAYFAGSNQELKQTLDVLLSNEQPFDSQANEELYERFFGAEQEIAILRETGDKVSSAVAEILECVDKAGEGTSDYARALTGVIERLTAGGEDVGEIVGGILVETRKMQAQNSELEARLKASSQEIAELREDLENARREAMTDALTGIANRKFFDRCLKETAKEAMENGTPVSLLLLDIDHFKNFNDTYGHLIGDQVLKIVARTMTECIKGRDTPARYGGEEFAVILPDTHLHNALKVAEQIRSTICSRRIIKKSTGEDFGVITASIGAAQFRFGESLAELIRRADMALYAAKEAGRNRVVS